jgi:RTX calcium-binding nonapeptide repeat (4 copies)
VRVAALTLGLVACCAVMAPAASAQGGSRQDATLTFTDNRPGEPTGLVLSIDYVNPDDTSAKPPAVRRVVTELAAGARYDTGAPELCTASDPELMAAGASACPEGSVVGQGVITIDTGFPGPNRIVTSDTTFLNNTDELIFLNTERQSGGRVVVRSEVGERTVTSESPPLPGTPPDGGAIDTVFVEDFAISRAVAGVARNYITTPERCPPRGFWVNAVHFTYFDGVSQTVETRSPCDPGKGAGPPSCKGRPATVVASPGSRTAGTPGDDVILGTGGRDRVASGEGDDLLCGRGGRDRLESGGGDDNMNGGAGADRLSGGGGDDRLRGGRGRDHCRGGPGRDHGRRC